MTQKLLSPEELHRIEQDYPPSTIQSDLHALLAHIAALEADNAALLGRLRKADVLFEWLTDNDSLSDDGRERTRVMRARTGTMLASAHPGTTLLSEHARALVRARNEGLEKAALRFDVAAASLDRYANNATGKKSQLEWAEAAGVERDHARLIRAMKETEE